MDADLKTTVILSDFYGDAHKVLHNFMANVK